MEIVVKQLTLNSKIFFPQTSAEAVLVKDKGLVITLDTVLNRKIELVDTPIGSGLQSSKENNIVTILHSNSITPNDAPSSVKVKYDNRGHIVETTPSDKLIVVVDTAKHTEYNGSLESGIVFGDDFKDEDNKIILKWNNI